MSIMEWDGMKNSIIMELGIGYSSTDKINNIFSNIKHRVADNTTYKIARALAQMEINLWNGRRY